MEEVKRKRGRPPKKKEPIVEEETQIIQEEVEDNEELSSTDEKLTPKKQMLKEYYDEVKKTSSQYFHIEPNENPTYECCMCHKEKPHTEFFRSYSWMHIGAMMESGERHLPVCKRCAKKIFNFYSSQEKVLKRVINHWCQTLDLYYSDDIYEKMMDLHNSRKNTVMETKFDYITDYITALGRAKKIGLTYWDSPYLQNNVNSVVDTDEEVLLDVSSEKEYPEEFDGWDKEDLEKYDYILRIYKFDPFKDEPIEDRKRLYNSLANLSDEDIMEDFTKANAAIDMTRAMQRLEKLNKIRIDLENAEKPDIKEIKEINNLQKSERETISKYGKDHGFIQKYSINKELGKGTLTGILKQMDTNLFEDALVNRYDISTCEGMQQAADASWKAIFSQLNLSESEFASVIQNQNETIRKQKKQLIELREKLRLANVELKREELQQELDKQLDKNEL